MTNQGQKSGFSPIGNPRSVFLHTPCPSTTSDVDPSFGTKPSGLRPACGVLHSTRGAQTSKTRCYQRCEHPGFPGVSSVCDVRVPWTNPSPVQIIGGRLELSGDRVAQQQGPHL
eukprot:1185671-Prorocentrum_minimum.AAC.2